jgi:hypothetical protein
VDRRLGGRWRKLGGRRCNDRRRAASGPACGVRGLTRRGGGLLDARINPPDDSAWGRPALRWRCASQSTDAHLSKTPQPRSALVVCRYAAAADAQQPTALASCTDDQDPVDQRNARMGTRQRPCRSRTRPPTGPRPQRLGEGLQAPEGQDWPPERRLIGEHASARSGKSEGRHASRARSGSRPRRLAGAGGRAD